ncbi:VPLPA-CTERM sorting domain-containing protein [Ruegeria sp. R13_0]|nr:VPLPA-CTERM sorting domain-containing protein [Ruegeria sp. R13_0]
MVNRVFALISALFLMTVGANAAPVTVDLTRGGDLSVSGGVGTFDVDGISGRVTAHNSWWTHASVAQRTDGIGVRSGRWDDTAQLDGLVNEWLSVAFDSAVRLMSVTFSHVDGNDDWDIYVDYTRIADESNANPFRFGDRIAHSFSVLADGHSCYGWHCYSTDNFLISSFTVAPVPLPASALLLIGGLAGFGVMRRRKQQQLA